MAIEREWRREEGEAAGQDSEKEARPSQVGVGT